MRKSIIYTLFALLFFSSCFEDLGNYDYKAINRMTIKEFEGVVSGQINVSIDDIITLKPVFTFEHEGEQDIVCEWFAGDSLIATAPVLNFPAKELTEIKAGKLRSYVKLKASNKNTGEIKLAGVFVDIDPYYITGWVTLNKLPDGSNSLNFIKIEWAADGKLTLTPEKDVYKNNNKGESLGNNVLSLRPHYGMMTETENIVAVRGTAPYNTDIAGNNFAKYVYTSNFFLGSLPSNFSPVDEFSLYQATYIINKDGNVYVRFVDDPNDKQNGLYLNEPYYMADGMNITRAFPAHFMRSRFALLNDAQHQRLLIADAFGHIEKFPAKASDYSEDFPPFYDLKGEIVYAERTSNNVETPMVAIHKSKDGSEVKLLKFAIRCICNANGISTLTLKNTEAFLLDRSLITDATLFAQPNRRDDIFFFSGGSQNNQLYIYNSETQQTKLYATFNAPITSLAVEDYATTDSRECANRTIAVADKSGKVHILDIRDERHADDQMGKRLIQTIEFDNGEIIQIINKIGYAYFT